MQMTLFGVDSSAVERLDQPGDGGSTPTSTLQKLRVQQCNLPSVSGFVSTWHYSRSVFGLTDSHCFRVLMDDALVGAAIFGAPAGRGVAKKYAPNDERLVELRRFCMIDRLPKNSESRVLGIMCRLLRKQGVQRVLSYADPVVGHEGTIYRAAGFQYLGTTSPRKHVMWNGKKYPDRNIWQTNFPYHLELRAALQSGEAKRIAIPGKHIYLRTLRGYPK